MIKDEKLIGLLDLLDKAGDRIAEETEVPPMEEGEEAILIAINKGCQCDINMRQHMIGSFGLYSLALEKKAGPYLFKLLRGVVREMDNYRAGDEHTASLKLVFSKDASDAIAEAEDDAKKMGLEVIHMSANEQLDLYLLIRSYQFSKSFRKDVEKLLDKLTEGGENEEETI